MPIISTQAEASVAVITMPFDRPHIVSTALLISATTSPNGLDNSVPAYLDPQGSFFP
ncbi:MAG: hypothetical protein H6824_14435 [Planctomycetaceae bacterium]|nr:hypothetical protein [Planctomycetaceae bacterium]